MMHAILAIIKLARVRCFEYVTDDECIIRQRMLCVCISRTSYMQRHQTPRYYLICYFAEHKT